VKCDLLLLIEIGDNIVVLMGAIVFVGLIIGVNLIVGD